MSCHVLCFLWRAGRSCLSSVKPRRMGRPNGSRSPYAPPPARPQSGGKDGGCELSHLTGAGRLAALSDCFCFPFRFFFLASAPPSRPPTLPQKAFFVVVALALLTMLQGTEARRGKGKRDDGGWEGDFCIEYPRQVPLVPGRWTGTVTPHRICARTVDAAQRSPGDQGQRHPRRYFIFFLSFFLWLSHAVSSSLGGVRATTTVRAVLCINLSAATYTGQRGRRQEDERVPASRKERKGK